MVLPVALGDGAGSETVSEVRRVVNADDTKSSETPWRLRPLTALTLLGFVLVCICGGLAALSFQFRPGSEPVERPILAVLMLLSVAFFCYLLAIYFGLQAREGPRLLAVIVLTSVVIRGVLLFSWPILEIDIYRYLWDGAVVLENISPYRYSPEQVRSASSAAPLPDQLERLVSLRDSDAALRTILARVHYGELPTIYPPVSQAVFAVAVLLTPPGAGVFAHLLVMKTLLVLFELGTVGVVIGLLRLCGRHVGWSVAYAWCPLLLKETANGGHLDALAVLLTTLALFLAVRPLALNLQCRAVRSQLLSSAALLALAVGAKIYPVVLVPLFALLWRRCRGWAWAALASVVFLGLAAVTLWPMLPAKPAEEGAGERQAAAGQLLPPPPVDTADLDAGGVNAEPQDPSGGLKAFLRRWEMNDFLFLLVVENLKPQGEKPAGRRAWFSVLPPDWKSVVLSRSSRLSGLSTSRTPFLLARLMTGIVFVVIVAWLPWRVRSVVDPASWLAAAFLIIAWFWLLSPTQNPWYWTWALPLVMFARSRAWLALSGLALAYYLRFWFSYHWPDRTVLGTPYAGAVFFDFVVTWFEFGPWFLWLAYESLRRWACRPLFSESDLAHRHRCASGKNTYSVSSRA